MSDGRRQQNPRLNVNRNPRTTFQLPKIQVGTGTHQDNNMHYHHASLSPLDDRRVNISCDNKMAKTTFYKYPQDFSSTAAAVAEEQKQKYYKQPLRSAHVTRNLFSGMKKKTRKTSQNNIKDVSNQCSSTPVILPEIRSTSSKRQETESSSNLPAIILRSPSMQLTGSATPGMNLSPSQLLNSNKSVQFKDQNEFLNLEKDAEQQMKRSQTPIFKKAPSLKHSTSGQQLQPIFESANEKKRKMTTEESSVNRSSQSRENNNNNFSTTVASFNHTLIFSGVPSSSITRKSTNKSNEEEIEKLRGDNQNLIKEQEMLRLSFQAAMEKKKREMEQLQLENSRLKFQLQTIQREQQKQADLAGKQTPKKNGQSSANNEQRKSILQKELVALQDAQFSELLMYLDIGYESVRKYAKQNEQEDALAEVKEQFNGFKLFVKEIQKQQQSQVGSRETNIEVNARLRFFPASLICFDHSQRLGKGGFGTVFRVKVGEQDMGQKVFEYDLEKEMSCLGERLEMLLNEVKIQTLATTLVDNSYFTQIFGISFEIRHHPLSGRTSFVFAFFMQLVGNKCQKEQKFITTDLKQHTALHIKDKDYQRQYIGLAVQIAEAVETLYNNHIVHSDLKPQNILLDSNNNIKIIDFGTSKINYHSETHDTLILGYTPRYCPIEHFDMTQLTPTTDVWSFGCLLFEMATGQEPWRGFKKSFDVRKALEDKQNLWANYVSQVDSHPEQFDPDVIKLIESCTAYENRPHPSYISEKMHEIYSRILQI